MEVREKESFQYYAIFTYTIQSSIKIKLKVLKSYRKCAKNHSK